MLVSIAVISKVEIGVSRKVMVALPVEVRVKGKEVKLVGKSK